MPPPCPFQRRRVLAPPPFLGSMKVPDAAGVMRTIEMAPYKLSQTPGIVTRGAPEFGADQTFVLSEILGVADEELAEMAIAGIFD